MNKEKYPIISKGEIYVEPLTKKFYGSPKTYPHEYNEAKKRLVSDLERIQDISSNSSEKFFEDKKIICVRLEDKFEAKSYAPSSLIADSDISLIGGRKYSINKDTEKKSKLYFLRANNNDITQLKNKLSSSSKDYVNKWRNEITTIRSIDLLRPEEKVLGFSKEWTSGNVEIIIHPLLNDTYKAINDFFNVINKDINSAMIRTYDSGLTFICMYMDIKSIKIAEHYNLLRSVKPINENYDDQFRMTSINQNAPKLPTSIHKSNVKVGIFDGGVETGVELLDPFVNNYDMVELQPVEKGLEHGSLVSSAVLYGNLAGIKENEEVKNPNVSVESFRIFPTSKTGDSEKDFQMYSTIDIIEKIVKDRTDIKIFNISIGPNEPILDDELNRFTYVCDKLTYDVEEGDISPLFCVAVGNNGNMEDDQNRIQPPSDMVNGLAVGAYTYNLINEKTRAFYSCKGPGREGAKIKPDLLEFGGTQDRPFVGVLEKDNKIGTGIGTSFASPIVAGKIGQLVSKSEDIVPHLARTLLIHCADFDNTYDKDEYGFGFCPENVLDALRCTDNNVTILYSGDITSASSLKLPIFMPKINEERCDVKIRWTISTIVNPNINDPDAYTNNCIEDTFYPNENAFYFNKSKSKHKLNLSNTKDIKKAKELMNNGYKKSDLPAPKSANKNFKESDLRNLDFKWDTIIRKEVSMRSTSLCNPFLSLHAIGRDEYEHKAIKYNVVITIDAAKFKGSLYNNILQQYNNLSPIKIQNINKIRITQ